MTVTSQKHVGGTENCEGLLTVNQFDGLASFMFLFSWTAAEKSIKMLPKQKSHRHQICLLLLSLISLVTAFSTASIMAKPSKRLSPYRDSTQLRALIPLDIANPLWKAVSVYAATDAVGFMISLATGSHVHLDLIGSGAFCLASLPYIFSSSATLSQKISSVAISIWSMKLASFLFYRATRVGHDMRLEETLSSISGTFGFWFITFLWNVCCSMPYLLGLLSTRSDPLFVQVGGTIYGVGLILETVADAQKWFFKQAHPGRFCNVGLWALSQHPNFFGNLVLWSGIFIMNIPALLHPSSGYKRLALALISPLFMWALLYGQTQGIVTNATQLSASKYGSDIEFQKYIQEVPAIIPKLW